LLAHARQLTQSVPAERLLAVDEPKPVTLGDLPSSGIEVQTIASLFLAPKILRHEQATRRRLLEEIPQAQIVHFSCHGATNWKEPLESGMLLACDEWVTVRDILASPLRGARLAALSACETGVIGVQLPDEVVALPSAFVRAGFAGVLASLWVVSDKSTAMLMQRFYTSWRIKGMTPILALQEAQQWLRRSTTRDADKFSIQDKDIPAAFRHVIYAISTLQFIVSRFFARMLPHHTEGPFEHPYWWAAFYFTGV
jgi:CHAT domain-containing protein